MALNGRKGPPPKLLDPQIAQRIIDAIRAGNYLEAAAGHAGIDQSTLHRWLTRGRTELARLEQPGTKIRPHEEPFVHFLQATIKARGEAEARVVAQIQSQIPQHWQAGAWWLERSFPQRWGRIDRVEVSGPEGGPIEVISAREDLAARIAAMSKRLAPAADVEADEA